MAAPEVQTGILARYVKVIYRIYSNGPVIMRSCPYFYLPIPKPRSYTHPHHLPLYHALSLSEGARYAKAGCFPCKTAAQCYYDEDRYEKCLEEGVHEYDYYIDEIDEYKQTFVVDGDHCLYSICQDGSMGKLCDVCEEDYFHSAEGICEPCANAGTSGGTALFVLAVLIGFVLFLGAAYLCAKPIYEYWDAKLAVWFDVGKVKVLVVTCQLVSSVSSSTGVIWPEPFYSFSAMLGSLQVSPFQVMVRSSTHYWLSSPPPFLIRAYFLPATTSPPVSLH